MCKGIYELPWCVVANCKSTVAGTVKFNHPDLGEICLQVCANHFIKAREV